MAYTIKGHKEEFIKALIEEGYSREAAIDIIDTRSEDEDWESAEECASYLFLSFNEYESEKELLKGVEMDSALFDKERNEYKEPSLDYVYKHYSVSHLSNGHYVIYCNEQ